VVIGSRDQQRAVAAAAEVAELAAVPMSQVLGTDNEAATQADLVVIAVPWAAHAPTVTMLAPHLVGQIVVDCVNPLGFDAQGAYPLTVPEGSAAEQAALLAPGARVVGAFHHVSAVLLGDPEVARIDADVLVVGDDREATDTVQAWAGLIPGMRGLYAGRLRNAGQLEALTANLISINRRYRSHAGIRISEV
jgi:8-hydroxy-5-deazaflavin:NADPH oxidoreductase